MGSSGPQHQPDDELLEGTAAAPQNLQLANSDVTPNLHLPLLIRLQNQALTFEPAFQLPSILHQLFITFYAYGSASQKRLVFLPLQY